MRGIDDFDQPFLAEDLLPSGRSLHRMPDSEVWGVDPDPGFVTPVARESYFEMLRRRRDFEIIHSLETTPAGCVGMSWLEEDLNDEQLNLAVEALRTRLDTGAWSPVSEADTSATAFADELRQITAARQLYLERLEAVETRLDELYDVAESAGRDPLLPDGTGVGTVIRLEAADGTALGTFRLEDGDLERALDTLDLERVDGLA